MNQKETAKLLDELPCLTAGVVEGGDGRGDDGGAGTRQLAGDKGDAHDVRVAVLTGEAEFGGEGGADGFAE